MEVVIGTLALIVAGQWILIWRLMDRLLITHHIPALGPVRLKSPAPSTASSSEHESDEKARRRLFRMHIPD